MNFQCFKAGPDDDNRRLDRVLRQFLNDENLSTLYKSLRKGLIKVNEKKCDGNFRVSQGDDIKIAEFLIKNSKNNFDFSDFKNQNLNFDAAHIILRTDELLFLNKPYDISVQPSASSKISLSEIVKKDFERNHKKDSLSFSVGPLHRLDRKTTGIITFSQNLLGARWFSESIKNHSIKKTYIGIFQGNIEKNQIWEDEIKKENPQNQNFHKVLISDDGKIAQTEVFPISHGEIEGTEITLAKILIKTGRTHQIRSQSAHHGFPLFGDTAYNGKKISAKWRQDFFLHALELELPKDNPFALPQKISAPLSPAFKFFLESSFSSFLSDLTTFY